MKLKLTFALMAILTSTAFASFPAPLPEFKNEKQLAEWRAEMAAKDTPQTTTTEDTAFYTGKPYLASSGSYAFKYRSYNPELARWTSEDPSGFPDGANGNSYVPIPTSEYDYQGLESMAVNVKIKVDYCPDAAWKGTFIWSFEHGHERDGTKITPDDPANGFTGFTNSGLAGKIFDVELGLGSPITAYYTDNSTMATKTIDGVQWKQWRVDLNVNFKQTLILGINLSTKQLGTVPFKKEGEWYE